MTGDIAHLLQQEEDKADLAQASKHTQKAQHVTSGAMHADTANIAAQEGTRKAVDECAGGRGGGGGVGHTASSSANITRMESPQTNTDTDARRHTEKDVISILSSSDPPPLPPPHTSIPPPCTVKGVEIVPTHTKEDLLYPLTSSEGGGEGTPPRASRISIRKMPQILKDTVASVKSASSRLRAGGVRRNALSSPPIASPFRCVCGVLWCVLRCVLRCVLQCGVDAVCCCRSVCCSVCEARGVVVATDCLAVAVCVCSDAVCAAACVAACVAVCCCCSVCCSVCKAR